MITSTPSVPDVEALVRRLRTEVTIATGQITHLRLDAADALEALSVPKGAGEAHPRFTWSRIDPGDMDYTNVTFGFGSSQDAEKFRRALTERQNAALYPLGASLHLPPAPPQAPAASPRDGDRERPQGAGWSEPPKVPASYPERLSADDLRLTGAALSEWAWDHLSKGYGVCLTVREVSRLIAGVRAEALKEEEEACQIAKRDGYDTAVQDIDLSRGRKGDGQEHRNPRG